MVTPDDRDRVPALRPKERRLASPADRPRGSQGALRAVLGEQDSAGARDLPSHQSAGKIPVLVLPDGAVISESAAILIHLTDLYPTARLAPPRATTAHARFLQWMTFLSSTLYETALRYYYAERYS